MHCKFLCKDCVKLKQAFCLICKDNKENDTQENMHLLCVSMRWCYYRPSSDVAVCESYFLLITLRLILKFQLTIRNALLKAVWSEFLAFIYHQIISHTNQLSLKVIDFCLFTQAGSVSCLLSKLEIFKENKIISLRAKKTNKTKQIKLHHGNKQKRESFGIVPE